MSKSLSKRNLFLLILFIFFFLLFLLFKNTHTSSLSPTNSNTNPTSKSSPSADNSNNTVSKSSVIIVKPDTDTIIREQAQLWEAEVHPSLAMKNESYQCYWTWYVNDIKKWSDLKGCKFTRQLPFESGDLKVKVRVEFTHNDYSSGHKETKVLDTITTQRTYLLVE